MVDLVKDGYTNGVPMGGTLYKLIKVPTFNVYAQKDPEWVILDRIQIIEVVWSSERKLDSKGKLPEVDNGKC